MLSKTRILALAILLLAFAGAGLAQVEDQAIGDPAGMEKMYKKLKNKITDLLESDKTPSKEDLKTLEFAAQYFIWRVTWPEYTENPEAMNNAIKAFERQYVKMKEKANLETRIYFNSELQKSFNKVFEREFLKNRLSSVNAALMFPVVGKGKSVEISGLLERLVKDDNTHDVIKLWAMRGLKEYFPLNADTSNEADVRRVKVLTDFIERKFDTNFSSQELAAIHFIRREAIRCLAHAELPAVKFQKKKVEGQIASTLLRVLAKNELEPPPTLLEKCYASFGLCNMKLEPRDYDPGLATYGIARTLSQFLDAYRTDLLRYREEVTKTKKGEMKLYWKALEEEWALSLTNFSANTKGYKGLHANLHANVDKLKTEGIRMLLPIKSYSSLEEQRVNDFKTIDLPSFKSAEKTPFKNVPALDGRRLDVDMGN